MTTTITTTRCLCGHTHTDDDHPTECPCTGFNRDDLTSTLWSDRPSKLGLQRCWIRTHTGLIEVGGEPTPHKDLAIVAGIYPDAVADEVYNTGGHDVLHIPTGYSVHPGHSMPLTWLRRYARLLAESGIDWAQLQGDTTDPAHPVHDRIHDLGCHVLTCWLHGIPVDDPRRSLVTDHQGRSTLRCGNPRCHTETLQLDDSPFWVNNPALLWETALAQGWSMPHTQTYWLCAICSKTHQTPQPEERSWLRTFLQRNRKVT